MIKSAVLIIGFNRPQMLQDRLRAIEPLVDKDISIYVSIDGPRDGNTGDKSSRNLILKQIEESPISNSVSKLFFEKNSGCDVHIFNSITKVLEKNDYVVVIEDDIEISAVAISELLLRAQKTSELDSLNPIVAMSGLSRRIPGQINHWRESDYFSAWGFALTAKFWALHNKNVKIVDPTEIERKLMASSNWKKLSKRKRDIWFERISRSNYDYAIQRTIFFEELQTVAPILRISNNVGHGIAGASHTRFKTPRFLRYSVMEKNDRFNRGHIQSGLIITVLKWLDSQTWAGDGLLSVRGRTMGVRTILRQIIHK